MRRWIGDESRSGYRFLAGSGFAGKLWLSRARACSSSADILGKLSPRRGDGVNGKIGIFLIVGAVAVALYLLFKPGGALNGGGPLVQANTTTAAPNVASVANPIASIASAFSGLIGSFENPPASSASNPSGNTTALTGALIQGANQAGSTYENPTVAVSDLQQGVVASTNVGYVQAPTTNLEGGISYGGTGGASVYESVSDAPVIDTTPVDSSDLLDIGSPAIFTADNTNDSYDYELLGS